MNTTIALPRTLAERNELPDEMRIQATWEEYLERADEVEYNIDYLNGEIISMGQASVTHELIIATLIRLIGNFYADADNYLVLGSNVKICIAEASAEFNADLSVVRGEPAYVTLPSGRVSTTQLTNPEIIVEVLSKSTKRYDQSDKLDQYRTIPSLQHVLFVDQESVFARTYSRMGLHQWLETDYRLAGDIIALGELRLNLRDVYRKTPLAQ